MNYNLTETQKDFARWIAQNIREKKLDETFYCIWNWSRDVNASDIFIGSEDKEKLRHKLSPGVIEALEADSLLRLVDATGRLPKSIDLKFGNVLRCTISGRLFPAVDTNFAEDERPTIISSLAQPHPPEIAMSLDRLRTKYPDAKRLGFLIMRFAAAKPFTRIVDAIKATGKDHGLDIVRADENEFHADLWGNVRTLLHGCGFGIAVYERIETNEPNANVGLEVGYLMAMNKPVLLLKDKTVDTLQADLAGKLYKPFDPHDPEGTIPGCLTKWLEDNGIVVTKHS